MCIVHIRSNKYKKYFWEYANDTFHEDFIDVMKDFAGYKRVISIISIKDLHRTSGMFNRHDYTSVPYYTGTNMYKLWIIFINR